MAFEKRLLQTYEGPARVSTPTLTLLCQPLTSETKMSIRNHEYFSQKIFSKQRRKIKK
jgi:hypothetical protein